MKLVEVGPQVVCFTNSLWFFRMFPEINALTRAARIKVSLIDNIFITTATHVLISGVSYHYNVFRLCSLSTQNTQVVTGKQNAPSVIVNVKKVKDFLA